MPRVGVEHDGLKRLLEVTLDITRVLDTNELLEKILDSAIQVTAAERGCLYQLDPDGVSSSDGWIKKRIYRHLDQAEFETAFSPSMMAMNEVMERKQGIIIHDALNLPQRSESIEIHQLKSILCEPLVARSTGKVIGIIYLDSSKIVSLFSKEHQELLRSFAAQAAICLENAQLFEEKEQETRRRMEEEMRAREMETRRDVLTAFVSIAAHDLKGPLTTLKGGLQILNRMDLRAPGPMLLDSMEHSVGRAIRLVQTYLDAMNMEEDRPLDLKVEAVELGALVDREWHAVEGRIPDKRKPLFPFQNGVPPEMRVMADVGRLEQVLGNLLDNAVKYSPDGGAVEVTAEPFGHDVVVAICDHGLGMDEASQSRLFERFVRVGNTGLVAGTGLGLWIVRRLVELLGGHIDVTSTPGNGSTFRFTLPAG